ncbi:MAG: prolyl oligopeptidase family serine peptidase, partial [Saprospiraceae bacterium]
SRIGKTLWEDPQAYISNSALFNIDKVTTPLLILHNDEDSAVPFEQGIEFYSALRRLGKKAWLLNYRGEPHWPVKWQNRKDFQIRMSQFFDHYLKGAPMPKWMEEGVPAVERGINRGY